MTPLERINAREGFLSRVELVGLGLPRRAVDSIFRTCPVVSLPGYSRPLVRVVDYLALIEKHTYNGDRVRPVGSSRG